MAFRPAVALLGAALLLRSVHAHAQPSAAQKETARGLMAEGRELREQGDLRGALTRFSAADSLMSVPTTGYELAATQAQLGKFVEARDTLRRVLAIAQAADDPEPFNEARSKARSLDQQLLGRIGALRFELDGVTDGEAVSVSVDGEALPRAALSVPFRVNPGRHLVVARASARELRREIDAAEGRTTSVVLAFAPTAVAAATPSPPASAPVSEPTATSQPQASGPPTLAYVGGGVALAGVVVGSVAGISAISHRNSAQKDCVDGSCPPSTWSDLDSAHSMATASTVGFTVGALGLVVAVGAILLDRPASPARRAFNVSPTIGARSANLTIGGSF
jgi:hypothetical protein